MQTFINNFRTTIAATFGASDTTLQLLSSTGLPDLTEGQWYTLTLFRLNGVEESGHEVVKVTSRTGNQLEVVRSWEGAAASQFLTGDICAARFTAGAMNDKADAALFTSMINSKEPAITAGTPGQYWRGDKTWATLNKAAVGLSAVDNTADVDKPVSTAQAAADTTVLNSAKAYAEGLVVGLYDDRGNYNASGNVFPSTGGSGPGGAIMKGDIWRISVAGNLGGTDVAVDQQIRALVDSPAQTSGNWGISGANFTITQSVTNGATGVVPSSDAVFDALAVKANSNNAALTGTTSLENLSFSGSTRRISGDFSHATHSNRVLFQTSTANSASTVGVMPSGTGNTGQWSAYNTSDPNNSSQLLLGINPTAAYVSSSLVGTGTTLPLLFNTGGIERFRLSGTSNRFQADFSNATVSNRLALQSSVANGLTSLGVLPNGTGVNSSILAFNSSDADNAGFMGSSISTSGATFIVGKTGTGAYQPLDINVGGANRLSFATAGGITANNGLTVSGAATYIQGGSAANLSSGGFLQVGGSAAFNMVFDYGLIQTRNNGANSTLSLNYYGGTIQTGGSSANNSNLQVNGTLTTTNGLVLKSSSNLKIQMNDGETVRGWLSADSSNCFGVINSGNSVYRLTLNNATGDLGVTGNVSAYSDETLKKDWKPVHDGDRLFWLAHYASIRHGTFTRIDTNEHQIGAGAQSVQKLMPLAVTEVKQLDDTTILSLDYGKAALVGSIETAAEVVELHARITKLEALVASLIGGAA